MRSQNNDATDHSLAEGVLSTAIVVLLTAPALLYGGWVFATMWSWFAVPNFAAAPLSLKAAIGVRLLVGLLLHGLLGDKSRRRRGMEIALDFVVCVFVLPTIALGIGWCVYTLM